MRLNHTSAAALMVLCTLMWSMAGVVTRHLESAQGFEASFWRTAFNALALGAALWWVRGGPALWTDVRSGGRWLWVSSLCWAVMFTNYMLALTLTTVAMVLITMSIAPLLTALFSRAFLRQRLPVRTWTAIGVAGLGIAWMYGQQALSGGGSMAGALVALGVPIAAAANFTLLQYLHQRHLAEPAVREPDMLPAVLLGALLSCMVTLPLAWPLSATGHDIGLLAMLGVVQLAIPCFLVIQVARVLPAAEVSLIGLLEVIFGVLLVWVGAGESPGLAALQGGALVVGALLVNEWLGLRARSASGTVAAPTP